MLTGYLPWYVGAACLALVTVGSCIVARRPLGLSSILARMVNLREELAADRKRAAAARLDQDALEAALLAATMEEFGPLPPESPAEPTPLPAPVLAVAPSLSCAATAAASAGPSPAVAIGPAPATRARGCGGSCASPAARPTVVAHGLFLGGVVLGGFLAASLRGGFHLTLDMGPDFARLLGGGGRGLPALAAGGLLAGMGTAIAGGCSTGHGLSGCSRLQPAGVAATAAFFGTAVAVSFLLAGVHP